jgi:hypothetical protein
MLVLRMKIVSIFLKFSFLAFFTKNLKNCNFWALSAPKFAQKIKISKIPITTFVLHPKGMLYAKFGEHWIIW